MTLSELFDKADEMVAKRYPDCNASIKEMNSYRDGYIHGMTKKLEGMVPVEKVWEWLEKNFFESHEIDCYGCFSEETEVTSSFDTMKELMESFHKAMEE